MTTNLRQHGDEALEAQRWEASQAARDAATLDVLNVLYVVKQMILDNRMDEAKAVVADWRRSKGVQG
jgi:hypothetical protein